MGINTTRILLFDGHCNLCDNLVKFIIKKDSRSIIKFASLQSPQGKLLLQRHDFPVNSFDFIIYLRQRKCLIKSTALLFVLRDLGGILMLFYPFIIIPAFIRDFLYDIIAKRRYKLFGRQECCMIPTPEIRQRFLE